MIRRCRKLQKVVRRQRLLLKVDGLQVAFALQRNVSPLPLQAMMGNTLVEYLSYTRARKEHAGRFLSNSQGGFRCFIDPRDDFIHDDIAEGIN